MCDSLQPHGLYGPWNSPGQSTGAFPFSRRSSKPRSPTLQVDSLPAEPHFCRFVVDWMEIAPLDRYLHLLWLGN